MHDLAEAYRRWWVEESVREGSHFREDKWTESLAVGSEAFVTATKEELGFKAKARDVIARDGDYMLRESRAPYSGILGLENDALSFQNAYFWDDNS